MRANRNCRLLVFLFVISLLVGSIGLPVSAESTKKLELYVGKTTAYVNGASVKLDAPPVIQNGRTLVPVRFISEQMGAKVTWDRAKKQVTIVQGSKTIILTINSSKVLVNGKSATIDVPAKIINDRTMVPVRFVSEQLGYNVEWIAESKKVIIDNSKVPTVSVSIISKDLEGEKVIVKNNGNTDVDMSDWKLISVEGNQVFTFPDGFILKKEQTVTITSGKNAYSNPPSVLKWTNAYIWNNDGDAAKLADSEGRVISTLPQVETFDIEPLI